jgi:hypothetical protein
VCQECLNDWYQTHQTVFGIQEGCNGKLDCCNDRLFGKLPGKEAVETPVTSTCLSVDCLESKTDHIYMSNKLLHTESAARCKHHMQVRMGCS